MLQTIIWYCGVNFSFYLIASLYRRKYYNKVIKKYMKVVEEDKPATILLAASKYTLIISFLILMTIVNIIKIVSLGKFKIEKYTIVNDIFVILSFVIGVLFTCFPMVLVASIISLFAKYTSERIDYTRRK